MPGPENTPKRIEKNNEGDRRPDVQTTEAIGARDNLQNASNINRSGDRTQDNASAIDARHISTPSGAPMSVTYRLDDGKAVVAQESRNPSTNRIEAKIGDQTYERVTVDGANGKKSYELRPLDSSGKPAGEAIGLASMRSGAPPEGTTADRYVQKIQTERPSNNSKNEVQNPLNPPGKDRNQFAPPPEHGRKVPGEAPEQAKQKGEKTDTGKPATEKLDGAAKVETPVKPGAETVKPGSEAVKPGSEAVKPGTEAVKPGTEAVKPGTEAGKPGTEATKPGSESTKPLNPADGNKPSKVQDQSNPGQMTPEQNRQFNKQQAENWRNMSPEQKQQWRAEQAERRNQNTNNPNNPQEQQAPRVRPGDQPARPDSLPKPDLQSRPQDQGPRPGDSLRPGDNRQAQFAEQGRRQEQLDRVPLRPERPGLDNGAQGQNIDRGPRMPLDRQGPNFNPEQGLRNPLRPSDIMRPGEIGRPGDGTLRPEVLRGMRPEGLVPQVDAKLLSQLQNMNLKGGQLGEGRSQLADMIGRFQEGKFQPGNSREVALNDMFKGMKAEQLGALKSFLAEGNNSARSILKFEQVDSKTQQNISKIFDTALGPQRGMELLANRMLDILGDKNRLLDKVPAGEQSRGLMLDMRLAAKDAGHPLNDLLSRNLGDKNSAELRLVGRDMESVNQALAARLRDRDLINNSTERSITAQRFEGKDFAVNRELAQSKDMMTGKELFQQKEDQRAGLRPTDAIKEAASTRLPEMTRQQKEEAVVRGNELDQRVVRAVNVEANKETRIEAKQEAILDAKTKQMEAEEFTIRKKKEDDERRAELQAQKERDEKLEQQRRLEEEMRQRKLEEEERKKKLEAEKQKEEEDKKKQQDPEFNYTVQDNDTLSSISGKFAGRSAEVIYARNEGKIALQEYGGRKFARVFPGQKIVIPNDQYISEYQRGTRSFSHLNFEKIPFASAEDEMAAWQTGLAAMRSLLGNDKDDDWKPPSRRSFSGKDKVSSEDRKENAEALLGSSPKKTPQDQPLYSVKYGESLRSIARKYFDDESYWKLIAFKNDLPLALDADGEPLASLKRGDKIALPDAFELESYASDPDGYFDRNDDAYDLFSGSGLFENDDYELEEMSISDEPQNER
ncbi:MAG: LysM peptidoglycan-binding domain-containing protein [Candidatus Obscuribacterales bacterium]|nr:LysM peptidoglycan-binding domain-containing protein [Candidatus Obscuribacterales bacterium]